jgi:SAM-dependent methyltransferase
VSDSRQLQWTGERFIPGEGGPSLASEHLHRYRAVSALVSGRRVVDLGSGEGYGSEMLARTAASVIGVDIAADAFEHARRRYDGTSGLSFVHADACATGLEAGSADVVVCFETIEHLLDQKGLVSEAARLLTPDGVFVVSTPDTFAYNVARAHQPNEFHQRELTRDEFVELLFSEFPEVHLLAQRIVSGSLLWDTEFVPPSSGDRGDLEQSAQLFDASCLDETYLVAICRRNRAGVDEPRLAPSLLIDHGDEMFRAAVADRVADDTRVLWARLAAEEEQAATDRTALQMQIEELQEQVIRARDQLAAYEAQLADVRARFDECEAQLKAARQLESAEQEYATRLAEDLRVLRAGSNRLHAELEHSQQQLRIAQAARAVPFDARWERQRELERVGRAARRDALRLGRAVDWRLRSLAKYFGRRQSRRR